MKDEEVKAPEEQLVTLVIDHVEYTTQLTKKYLQRKPYSEILPGVMKAFIPGTITKVYVKAGQAVKEGDELVVLEAMKMLNEIRAPFNGNVKAISVVEGDKVTKNQVLIELE